MQRLPIFPCRLQQSIVGASELNFCVRYEYRWFLTAIVTAMVYIQDFRLGYIFLRPLPADSQLHSITSFQVPSALLVKVRQVSFRKSRLFSLFCDQALDLLVSVSSTYHYAYTPDLSNSLSLSGLTNFRYGISYLEVSFTLRCFQRLSNPHFAILPCRWRDNRCTIGAFIPVLSY